MASSSIWMERMEDGASASGLNQRLAALSDGEPTPPGGAAAKPDVLNLGLCAMHCCCCCFFTCSAAMKGKLKNLD